MATVQWLTWFESAEDYDPIRSVINDEPRLPLLYEEWLQAAHKRLTELEAIGVTCKTVIVDPQQFAKWCKDSGVDQNMATLDAYTIFAARKQDDS